MHSQLDETWTKSRRAPDRDLLDEEEPNQRLKPFWQKYQHLLCTRGLCLDTIKNVRKHDERDVQHWCGVNDRSLCHDPSLVRAYQN